MAAFRVRVMRVVGMAYRDFARVLYALPRLVIIALLILLANEAVALLFLAPLIRIPVLGVFVQLAAGAVKGFLLTPFFIAIHRFIILDEITRGYVLDLRNPRFFQFFVWSFALTAFAVSMAMLVTLVLFVTTLSTAVAILAEMAVIVFAAIIMARLAILFPAIAVDAPGANAPNAFADTKGHVLAVFFIFFLAWLPIIGIYFAAMWPWLDARHSSSPVATAASIVLSAVTMPLFVALASRIFQALADRLVRPTAVEGSAPI